MSNNWSGDLVRNVSDQLYSVTNSAYVESEKVTMSDANVSIVLIFEICNTISIQLYGGDIGRSCAQKAREKTKSWTNFQHLIAGLNLQRLDNIFERFWINKKMLTKTLLCMEVSRQPNKTVSSDVGCVSNLPSLH